MPYVGNGYFSQRVPPAGAGYQADVGTSFWPIGKKRGVQAIVAGLYAYGRFSTIYPDMAKRALVAVPTWSSLSFAAPSGEYSAQTAKLADIENYRQVEDLRSGTVTTTGTWTAPGGEKTAFAYRVFADRARKHVGVVALTLTPRWSGALTVTGLFDGAGALRLQPGTASVDTPPHRTVLTAPCRRHRHDAGPGRAAAGEGGPAERVGRREAGAADQCRRAADPAGAGRADLHRDQAGRHRHREGRHRSGRRRHAGRRCGGSSRRRCAGRGEPRGLGCDLEGRYRGGRRRLPADRGARRHLRPLRQRSPRCSRRARPLRAEQRQLRRHGVLGFGYLDDAGAAGHPSGSGAYAGGLPLRHARRRTWQRQRQRLRRCVFSMDRGRRRQHPRGLLRHHRRREQQDPRRPQLQLQPGIPSAGRHRDGGLGLLRGYRRSRLAAASAAIRCSPPSPTSGRAWPSRSPGAVMPSSGCSRRTKTTTM